ncbi:unnamed protein product [Taenia asiatica]|uniref:PWI domain-containing protein n=1 Tax=Taenia asiatica TaxID=60517 RepID=A0A0R3VWM2_TAEAS|nr:unnamed protein product [Taenia asiatica]
MGSLYKLLLSYNKSDHGIGDTLSSTFDGASLSDGLISLVLRVLLDQALWETAIKLPPSHGVLGLLLATIMAFCIPAALSVICGLGFRALESAFHNAPLLNATHRVRGIVVFVTPMHLFGNNGIWIILIVILLLLVTSCMFSIVGASSILYHDVLVAYVRPFKEQVDKETCILCGKRRGHLASRRNICRCRSMLECAACDIDTWIKEECRNRPSTTLVYGCQIHGAYRAYADEMSRSLLPIAFTVIASMVPLFIIFSEIVMADFLFYCLCTPFVGCFCLSILWDRLSKTALLIGYFVAVGASLTLWFVLNNASSLCSKEVQLVGLGAALIGGFLLPALITLRYTKPLSPKVASSVWCCVQEIDNPLMPWPEVFSR